MRNLDNELKNKAINYEELLKYGFIKENEKYIYKTYIQDNQFEVNIVISDTEKYSKVMDLENEMEFALVDVENAEGQFLGVLKQDYENVINDVIEKCTSKEVYKSNQAKEVIKYIEKNIMTN